MAAFQERDRVLLKELSESGCDEVRVDAEMAGASIGDFLFEGSGEAYGVCVEHADDSFSRDSQAFGTT